MFALSTFCLLWLSSRVYQSHPTLVGKLSSLYDMTRPRLVLTGWYPRYREVHLYGGKMDKEHLPLYHATTPKEYAVSMAQNSLLKKRLTSPWYYRWCKGYCCQMEVNLYSTSSGPVEPLQYLQFFCQPVGITSKSHDMVQANWLNESYLYSAPTHILP